MADCALQSGSRNGPAVHVEETSMSRMAPTGHCNLIRTSESLTVTSGLQRLSDSRSRLVDWITRASACWSMKQTNRTWPSQDAISSTSIYPHFSGGKLLAKQMMLCYSSGQLLGRFIPCGAEPASSHPLTLFDLPPNIQISDLATRFKKLTVARYRQSTSCYVLSVPSLTTSESRMSSCRTDATLSARSVSH